MVFGKILGGEVFGGVVSGGGVLGRERWPFSVRAIKSITSTIYSRAASGTARCRLRQRMSLLYTSIILRKLTRIVTSPEDPALILAYQNCRKVAHCTNTDTHTHINVYMACRNVFVRPVCASDAESARGF